MSEEPSIACVCGRTVLRANWENHTLAQFPPPPHVPLEEPVNGLTVEETRLLQRLDLLEGDRARRATLGGKALRARIVNRLTQLAQFPEEEK